MFGHDGHLSNRRKCQAVNRRHRKVADRQQPLQLRAHKTKSIAAIQLLEFGNDERLSPRYGNPQALSHDAETDENPRRVWAFKRLQHAG
jgi:hypothetical protein